jgi:multidrug resistance efflux pump
MEGEVSDNFDPVEAAKEIEAYILERTATINRLSAELEAAQGREAALAEALRRARDDLERWARFGPATHEHAARALADDLAAIDAVLAKIDR